jgi:hypothetical protein
MEQTFPWGDVSAFDDWCRAYAESPTVSNLNSLHLAASILYAKLSTYVMDTNAGSMDDGTD